MQVINLLYATVFTSIAHAPQFIPLFVNAIILVLFFTLPLIGVGVPIFKKNVLLLLTSSFYSSVALFVVTVDLLARLGVPFLSAILIISCLLAFAGFIHLMFFLKKGFYTVTSSKKTTPLFFLLFSVLLTTFFLSKFIYNNGLHDEYQHHAAVEDMLEQKKWPIRDEMRYGLNLSEYYHYGWYYLVILVKSMFTVSTELALDITKLTLFIPVIPFLFSFQSFFSKNSWERKLALVYLLLFSGPALFFLDAYSGNVLFLQKNQILYQPLFFQLAGITWFGIIFLLVFLLVMYSLLESSRIAACMFGLFSFWALFLLNKVYLLVFIPALVCLLCYRFRKKITCMVRKNRTYLLAILIVLSAVAVAFMFFLQTLSPLLYGLIKGHAGIPFIRSYEHIGFPLQTSKGLVFQNIFSIESLRAFGLLPVITLFLLLVRAFVQKEKFVTGMLFFLWLYMWLAPAVLNFSGSELALNKLYIPGMWLNLVITSSVVKNASAKIRVLFFTLLLTGFVAPFLYFSSISLSGNQIYWNRSDAIITYLAAEQNPLVVIIDDYEYGKYLINNLDIRLISASKPRADTLSAANYRVTSMEIPDRQLVTKTESHFLYEE